MVPTAAKFLRIIFIWEKIEKGQVCLWKAQGLKSNIKTQFFAWVDHHLQAADHIDMAGCGKKS